MLVGMPRGAHRHSETASATSSRRPLRASHGAPSYVSSSVSPLLPNSDSSALLLSVSNATSQKAQTSSW